jgi:hypothetical protein
MPEWYFLLLLLGFVNTLGASWTPLLWLTPLLIASVGLTLVQAVQASMGATFDSKPNAKLGYAGLRLLVVWLHLVQPAARLLGRVQHGMGPWSWKGITRVLPVPTIVSLWTTRWQSIESRLSTLASILNGAGAPIIRGGDFDRWDLSIPGGLFGTIRVIAMAEEHGEGRQLCRFRARPMAPNAVLGIFLLIMVAAGVAVLDRATIASSSLALTGCVVALLIYRDCAHAMSQWRDALDEYVNCDDSLCLLPRLLPR